MGLSAGSRLGPYEIVSPLGAGGMGEVYRAKDTRLDRMVAIKVLLSQFSADAELKQRFEREARSISSLQHSSICTLYDVGEHEGAAFLVMELLEGETLAVRLQRGSIPLPELVKIASQVADALEKAHRSGIVHRDLKPGNIMLTKSGTKLMDFGLAKPLARMASASGTNASAPLLSAAITVSSPSPQMSPLTTAGSIVGTIQYMSPEQIEGREADARSDIFALGAVMYEMATGKRAFQGKSQITVASAILEKDPEPVSAVHPATPVTFDRIVQTCLAKDPEERFQTAQDVKLQLRWVTEPANLKAVTVVEPAHRKRWLLPLALLTLLAASLAVGYWLLVSSPESQPVRATIDPPEKVTLDTVGDFAGAPVLSPDGRMLAFAAHAENSPKALWVRPLDSFSAQRLEGTEGASDPFWSPDSSTIGFFANGKLNRIAATGGPVTAIADAPNARGGTWLKNDWILYAPDYQSAIYRVSANGGPAEAVTKLDTAKHSTHRWPSALPDGKHFLYLATNHNGGRSDENGIYFASVDGKQNHLVIANDSGGEFASGYFLYHAGAALVAQRMDPSSGKLSGTAQPIVDKVRNDAGVWRTLFTVSQNGRLVYQVGAAETSGSQLVWVDRTGKQGPVVGPRGAYIDPRLSPDGKRLAVGYGDPNREIYVMDLERGTQTRFTFAQGAGSSVSKTQPAWSPDGKFIAYTSTFASGGGSSATFVKAANGSGPEKVLVKFEMGKGSPSYPSWTPDGKYVVYLLRTGPAGYTVWAAPVDGGAPFVVLAPASPQSSILYYRISPNGRWIAYVSDESGRTEVYVAPFLHGEGKWQVSTEGAFEVAWRGDSKEVYYYSVSGDYKACAVNENGNELEISTPQKLFSVNGAPVGNDFDPAADGKRFLMNLVSAQEAPASLHLVTNWMTELKKK